MRFHADWRSPVLVTSLATLNIVFALLRFHRHGWHDGYAWFQMLSWVLLFAVWSMMLVRSWQFESDRLVMKRLVLPDVNIPYRSITSVDCTNQRNIVLTLGGTPIFRGVETQNVIVRDMPGFLAEMEHHVTPQVLHL